MRQNGAKIDKNGAKMDKNGAKMDKNGAKMDKTGAEFDKNSQFKTPGKSFVSLFNNNNTKIFFDI
jgi:hypothetical protein